MCSVYRYKARKGVWRDTKWLKKVRLQRDAFYNMRDQLRPQLKQIGNNHLTTGEQLFAALLYLAHGGTYTLMAEACGVSEPTICRRVATAVSNLQDDYIKWPTGDAAVQQVGRPLRRGFCSGCMLRSRALLSPDLIPDPVLVTAALQPAPLPYPLTPVHSYI